MSRFIADQDLPAGFSYPASFLRVVELGLVDLEPWCILDGERLNERYRGLQERYQARELVPFARRQDNDDVACWDVSEGSKVLIIHDFADLGWELRQVLPSFYAWLRQAVEDLIEFEPED
ncbi:MAG TPA: hypothetical protein VFG33_07310 [Kribbella sp.]|uniref:hypothetical protein n=1 Tax=Kribbella sp. TaxID=1871183 RepID=UPI002D78FB94|nr:hypothetical protein [Kribbella sp.]HET6293163.1 hypothetical protein [Kribbella sp.]